MKYVLALGLSLLAGTADAGFTDGNRLQDWCPDNALLSGYVGGVLDRKDIDTRIALGQRVLMGSTTPSGQAANAVAVDIAGTSCVPESVILKQYIAVTCRYLAQHPENRQMDGAMLIQMANEEAWPCHK